MFKNIGIAIPLASMLLTAAAPIDFRSDVVAACSDGRCKSQITPRQLLDLTQRLVLQRRFAEAQPLIDALGQVPDYAMEQHFLDGYVAVETGNLPRAANRFRQVLAANPRQVRARLELARVLMMQGKTGAADHHYQLAQEAADLPPDIARTIYAARSLIRERKVFHATLNVALAPDSNINNATDARTIDFIYNNGTIPLTLNPDARRKSGLGQQFTGSTGLRAKLGDRVALTADADGQALNYRGKDFDDVSALLAAGPEVTFHNDQRVAVQALAHRRWYGGRVAAGGPGARITYQKYLKHGERIGLQFETRGTTSHFADAYSGQQYSGYASYERVVKKTMIASATLFVRRDDLHAKPFSSTEAGASVGIGGELPRGLNAGLSVGVSRARFDEPLPVLSPDARHDWRANARAYLGLRSVRVLGFSPSITYNYSQIFSSLPLYDAQRHRVAFELARYF